MNEEIMKEWIVKVWAVCTRKNRALLILDSFSAHLCDTIQDLYNTTVIVIPGGCTSVLQPLDVSVNRLFKDQLRKCWEQYMLQQSDAMNESDGKIKPPTKQHLVDWIIDANEQLDSNITIVKNSFLVTEISNALSGYENHLIRNDVVRQEIQEILAEVFGDEHVGFDPSDRHSPDPFANNVSTEEEQEAGDVESLDDSEMSLSDYSVEAPEIEVLTSDTDSSS